MALARLVRKAKLPYGLWVKMAAVVILGLCFIFIWSVFSTSSNSVATQRESFSDIAQPVWSISEPTDSRTHVGQRGEDQETQQEILSSKEDKKVGVQSDLSKKRDEKSVNGSVPLKVERNHKSGKKNRDNASDRKKESVGDKENQELEEEVDGKEVEVDRESENEGDVELVELSENRESEEDGEDGGGKSKGNKKEKNAKGPLFDSNMQYSWKLCSTRSKHNYMPCIDNESVFGRLQSYRHRERSCPKNPPTCLVPLPRDGYFTPVKWPESKLKILYKNVAHPRLAAFIKKHNWIMGSGEYLTFPQNQSVFKGGVQHYLEAIEEMVPDIEWGKNIRVVLDVGCTDSSFAASLLDKEVLTLSLGLKDDLVDLAQVTLERGFAAVVSPFGIRRLPFPSGVFDAIHCGGCSISWHSNGGKLLLEMNRILRPGGYFILSTKYNSIEVEEAMTPLTASICWNILTDKTDEVSEAGVRIYQKPQSNDIYELRRKKIPPMCKENENPDAAWYVHINTCLHTIPSAIEERGSEWPEEWPKRLESFPDWLNNKEKVIAETNHWKSIVDKSYVPGLGIDWSNIRNVMDMKSVYGGFATALANQTVWVMNVVPVHAPDTLPVIFERGLFGIYHDWCESFGTYPRSYDLLHADHLFSRQKRRCKKPVAMVVEMDRLLRPGGWVIIREKVEIMDPLERILRSMQWDIRMTYAKNTEGILCAQKSLWRP